jgi:hypothetical protein
VPNFATASAARVVLEPYLAVAVGGSADVTLTVDQSGFATYELTGSLTGSINLILTLVSGDKGLNWTVFNNTSGAYTVTVKPNGAAGVAVTQGKRARLQFDGTNIVAAISDATAFGAAAAGANADITALTAITGGISMSGGLNVAGAIKGKLSLPTLGHLTKSVAGNSDVTPTNAEYVNPHQEYTGALTGNINVILPLTDGGLVAVFNNTSGAFSLTVKGSSGTGITVPQGKRQILGCDGTNYFAWAPSV